ncbi:MAG: 23S rRNA (pseudouridine(1915)-N(3))-methyltransferase RlmH [Pseudomonadota bacterium]|nr:23S rRNA (pseudouridine(1915)-N(3))-methyltransferase RlmH [Pseudomonadota bacterium]
MHIYIHAIGTIGDAWLNTAIQAYQKRIPKPFSLSIHDYATPKRFKHAKVANLQAEESRLLLQSSQSSDILVYLDERGESYASPMFSKKIQEWQLHTHTLRFLIGGPDGHCRTALKQANTTLSLSKMTLPHGLARLILVEQIYRAIMIQNNHPYHR